MPGVKTAYNSDNPVWKDYWVVYLESVVWFVLGTRIYSLCLAGPLVLFNAPRLQICNSLWLERVLQCFG